MYVEMPRSRHKRGANTPGSKGTIYLMGQRWRVTFCMWREGGEELGRKGFHVQAGLASGRSQCLPTPATAIQLSLITPSEKARPEEGGLGDH